MSNLISELKAEHQFLATRLKIVRSIGIKSVEGRDLLIAAKSCFLDHLKKEDEQLYPSLNKASENNEELKKSLSLFSEDLNNVTHIILDFFEKYTNTCSGEEFEKDFEQFYLAFAQRVSREERVLYPKYDELITN